MMDAGRCTTYEQPIPAGESPVSSHSAIVVNRIFQWRQLDLYCFIKILIITVLFCFLFYGQISVIVSQWFHDSSWSHGFLIPIFSLYFINLHKHELLNLKIRPDYLGLVFLLCSILFYFFNLVSPSGWAYFRSLSMLAALGSVMLLLGGWGLMRYTAGPIAFLVFAVPLPERMYRAMTIPLRQWAASAAAGLLNMVGGVEAVARGAVVDVIYQGRQIEPSLDVAEACSGMRLLMAFLALGVVMAYLHRRPAWQRIILIVSTVPIAIFCNIVRVAATGFIYVLISPKYAQGIYHDALGLAMLPLALGLYGMLTWFMSNLFAQQTDAIRTDIIIRRVIKGDR
jgi:exosortase